MSAPRFSSPFLALTIFLALVQWTWATTHVEPVAYFPWDNNGKDIAPGHHQSDPTLSGDPLYTVGKSGQAFNLTGNHNYVDLQDSSSWFLNQSFSVGFWLRDDSTDAIPQQNGTPLIGQRDSRSGTNYWEVVTSTAAGGTHRFRTNNGAPEIPFSLTRGAWHFILLVRGNLTATVYVDGIAQGTSTGARKDSFLIPGTIRIGADYNLTQYYKGAIDEVRFYDRALEPFEIAQVSNGNDVAVSGQADIYLAGLSSGATSTTGDSLPSQGPAGIAVQELDVLLITVSGTVDLNGASPATGPDGGANIIRAAEHSLGAYTGPGAALVATFLNAAPPSGPAPTGLDFSDNGSGLAEQAGQPELKQVFYIGGNTFQAIITLNVPQFATRLFLGVSDGGANGNNSGAFSVHVVSVKESGIHQTTVQGVTNIFKAPAGSPGDGFYPDNSMSFPAAPGKFLTFSSVTGSVTVDVDNDPGEAVGAARGPDGGTYQAPLDVAGANGLSGIKASTTGGLVGVFLSGFGDMPTSTPATLDFTAAGLGSDFTTLAPAIGQVFFIGDGQTSSGQIQKFTVPATATGFYLGIADGSNSGGAPGGYANNGGSMVATYRIGTDASGPTTPATSAVLSIGATAVSTSDPTGKQARVGEDLTYTLSWTNTGDAPAKGLKVSLTIPTYLDSVLGTPAQFGVADLTFNQFGTYIPASGPNTLDARILWTVADLAPTFQQSVDLKVHLSSKVLAARTLVLPNDYSVYSTAQPAQPATAATGFLSHSPNVTTDVLGPIKYTLTPNVTSVAPGGYITYSAKVENLTVSSAPAAALAFQLPAYTRFVGFGLSSKGVPIADPAGAVQGRLIEHGGNPAEVVIYFGAIAAHKSATALITLQAQWVDPAEVLAQQLSTLQTAAAFISPVGNVSTFLGAFKAVSATTDFVAFLKERSHSSTYSVGDNGPVLTSYAGSLANAPKLSLIGSTTDVDGTHADDPILVDLGSGDSASTVEPGKSISFVFGVLNNGKSPAEDVYLRMKLPDGTHLATPTDAGTDLSAPLPKQTATAYAASLRKAVAFFGASKNAAASKIEVTLDGRYLLVSGIHLDAANAGQPDLATVVFTVRVKTAGDDAPAIGQTIHGGIATVGTSSDTHTPAAIPGELLIDVSGPAVLAQLPVAPYPPNPRLTHDLTATANALTALYKSNINAAPLVANTHDFIPGVERFYIHYRNNAAGAIQNVDIDVQVPEGAVFYRALFVAKGAATLAAPASGGFINAPAPLASSGNITFHLNRLNSSAEGDVLLEVIVTDAAKKIAGTGLARPVPIIHNAFNQARFAAAAATTPTPPPAVAASGAPGFQKARDTDVPNIGVIKIVPRYVRQNSTFPVTFMVVNYGDTPAKTLLHIPIPAGTHYVSSQGGNVQQTFDPQIGVTGVSTQAVTNGALNDPNNPNHLLLGHSIATLNVILGVNAPNVGSTLHESGTSFTSDFQGQLVLPPADIVVEAADSLKSASPGNQVYHDAVSMHLIENSDDASSMLIPLGGGNVALLAGFSDYSYSGNALLLVDNLAALHVVTGPETDITLKNVVKSGDMTVAAFQGKLGPLLKDKAITILNVNASNIVSLDGAGIVSNSNPLTLPSPLAALAPANSSLVHNIVVTGGGGQLVASGGGNLVASGGGNLVASGGGNIVTSAGGLVASGGGNLVASGGGNLVASGGGNLVASGGGNLVASGGGNLVASGGGNVVAVSGGNTTSLVASGGGNIVASGGGNLVASGGGN